MLRKEKENRVKEFIKQLLLLDSWKSYEASLTESVQANIAMRKVILGIPNYKSYINKQYPCAGR